MYEIRKSRKFRKSIKKYRHHAGVPERMREVFVYLQTGKSLPKKYLDHPLKGHFSGFRELHLFPNILVVYYRVTKEGIIVLQDIGSHSDLFG